MRMFYLEFRDMSLEVLKEKPEGAERWPAFGYKAIYIKDKGEAGARKLYYFCPGESCEGWIEGLPNQGSENTLGPLCGRSGKYVKCRRCGHEISFFGVMS